ncbi:hypothetical protein [Roseibium sp.]|uniref:hypothetical protein n=1 Tax=Roseibium sp. TaxID=1936156 RepID=UPI003A9709FA
MSDRHRYITLVTSFPHLGRLFSQSENPLSEFRLKQRLTMLEPMHRQLLDRVLTATTWAGVSNFDEDSQVVAQAKTVIEELKDYPALQDLVASRMETRTLITGLRRRRDGADSAGDIHVWGFGRWRDAMAANWSDPGFGLSHFIPWVPKADQHLRSGDHIAMERLVLTEVYNHLDRAASRHQFDFAAVVIYVLRWVIVERWSRYDTAAARNRLQKLLSDVLETSPASIPSASPASNRPDQSRLQEMPS